MGEHCVVCDFLACDCDLTGSQDNVCEKHGGQCSCKVGFGGRRCDRCIPGHYELLSECKRML